MSAKNGEALGERSRNNLVVEDVYLGRNRRMSRRRARKRWCWREIEGARIVIGDIEYCGYLGTIQTKRRMVLAYGTYPELYSLKR